ncbi:hypothetical protein D3C71_1682290 [compost metagenome]
MLALALGQRDLGLDQAVLPVQVQRHQGVALLLDLADQALDLFLVQQQLLGACGVGAHVGRSGAQRIDLAADKVQLAVLDDHVAVGQLDLAFAQGLDFPAVQDHARFVAFLEEVVVSRFFVVGNAGRGISLFCHV